MNILTSSLKRFTLMAVMLMAMTSVLFADGTEVLGPPSIAIASGSGYVSSGVGLTVTQPGFINLNVPAGAIIKQVLIYWEGQHTTPNGDADITVGGNAVTGTLIGGPTLFFNGNVNSSTYRADITSLNLVSAGANSISVGDMNFNYANNGAGIFVIYDDGSPLTDIQLVDGNDLAYRFFASPLDATVPKTFTFASAAASRTAKLSMFFSSVQGPISGSTDPRPNEVRVTIGGTTTVFTNELVSNNGDEWDTMTKSFNIPAGETQLTVVAVSGPGGFEFSDPRPSSLAWNAAGLSILPPPPPPLVGQGCSPGYWKNHRLHWPSPYQPNQLFSSVFENAFPGKSLLWVLKNGGGGLSALGRHTVCALLNAKSLGTNFGLTPGQVITMFNNVFPGGNYEGLKNIFEGLTDVDGRICPLNKEGADVEVATYSLQQNYPNPFNPSTEISFEIPHDGNVSLKIFNTLGQEVKTLVSGQLEAGVHTYTWDAKDNNGKTVGSGMYFYQFRSGEVTSIKKMSFLK